MTLGSRIKGAWRAAGDALARLNRLLVETGNSDDDLVFHIRRSADDRQSSERQQSGFKPRKSFFWRW